MYLIITLMFIAFFGGGYQVFAIGTYGVTSLDILTLLFILIFLKKVIWDGEKLRLTYNPAIIFIVMLMLAALFSGFAPITEGFKAQIIQYFKTTVHLTFLIMFALICGIFPIKHEIWTRVIRLWLIISIFINVFGIYQIFARAYNLPFAWLEMTNVSMTQRGAVELFEVHQLSLKFENFFRATSIFSEPSALAAFNIYIIIFMLIPYIQGRKPFFKSRLLNTIIFSGSIISLFLAFSMTGIAGIILIVGGIILFQKSRKILYVIGIALVSLVIIFIADSIVSEYSNISVTRLFNDRIEGIISGGKSTRSISGESFFTRIKSAEESVRIWSESPVFGIGLGQTEKQSETIMHSDYSILAALSEMGIPGAAAFIAIFIAMFYTSLKIIKKPEDFAELPEDLKRLYGLCFYILLLQFLINFITSNNLISYWLWNPLAIIVSIYNSVFYMRNNKVREISLVKTPLKHLVKLSASH